MSPISFHGVPVWVFVLLVALIALGVAQSLPRSVALRRTAVLPVVLLGVSMAGVVSTFGAVPAALAAWAAGVAASVVALHGRVDVKAVHYDPAQRRFELPGSWAPLALILGVFAVKFAVGMTLGRQPALASSLPLAVAASAAYGSFSGAFLGRAMALWAVARRAA